MCTETGKAPSEKVGFPCFFAAMHLKEAADGKSCR